MKIMFTIKTLDQKCAGTPAQHAGLACLTKIWSSNFHCIALVSLLFKKAVKVAWHQHKLFRGKQCTISRLFAINIINLLSWFIVSYRIISHTSYNVRVMIERICFVTINTTLFVANFAVRDLNNYHNFFTTTRVHLCFPKYVSDFHIACKGHLTKSFPALGGETKKPLLSD